MTMHRADGTAGRLREWLEQALDAAVNVQQPVVERYVRRVRDRNPDATPAEVVAMLEKQYLAAVTGAGAAVGGTAAAPGVGTSVATVLSLAEVASTLDAGAVLALAVAHVHGIELADLERRRTLLLAVFLGDGGGRVVERVAGHTGKHWGQLLTDKIPMSTIQTVNRTLGGQFITKYGTKKGLIVIGRMAPFAIGAAIGAAGNAVLGRSVVSGVRRAFGPPPAGFPGLKIVESERIDALPSVLDRGHPQT
jgi:hypothetical protein